MRTAEIGTAAIGQGIAHGHGMEGWHQRQSGKGYGYARQEASWNQPKGSGKNKGQGWGKSAWNWGFPKSGKGQSYSGGYAEGSSSSSAAAAPPATAKGAGQRVRTARASPDSLVHNTAQGRVVETVIELANGAMATQYEYPGGSIEIEEW